MTKYHYTLSEHDMDRLKRGEELIAEEDNLENYAAIRIRWAWTAEEALDDEERPKGMKEK
jgi:hypothetical protein